MRQSFYSNKRPLQPNKEATEVIPKIHLETSKALNDMKKDIINILNKYYGFMICIINSCHNIIEGICTKSDTL